MTLSDLECLKLTSSASHAISAVAELLVVFYGDHMMCLVFEIRRNVTYSQTFYSDAVAQ